VTSLRKHEVYKLTLINCEDILVLLQINSNTIQRSSPRNKPWSNVDQLALRTGQLIGTCRVSFVIMLVALLFVRRLGPIMILHYEKSKAHKILVSPAFEFTVRLFICKSPFLRIKKPEKSISRLQVCFRCLYVRSCAPIFLKHFWYRQPYSRLCGALYSWVCSCWR
jgi:hypothetical protein